MPNTHSPFGVLRAVDACELLQPPPDLLDNQVLAYSRCWQVVGIFVRCTACGYSQKASAGAQPFLMRRPVGLRQRGRTFPGASWPLFWGIYRLRERWMKAGIQEETLRAMLEASAVREVLVSRHGEKWGLAIRLGGAGSRWLPVRSRREALRTWASLTAVGRFAEGLGVKGFAVEL